MALELSRKELRLRARHPAAAQDQRVVQPRAVDPTVTTRQEKRKGFQRQFAILVLRRVGRR